MGSNRPDDVTKRSPDVHAELPLDPDAPRPLHRTPSTWAWVFAGGFVGTGLRWFIELAVPTVDGTWPWATYVINVGGAFILGALLEALAVIGPDAGWWQRIRLFAGTGVCGAFTTYSTLALEVSLLARDGAPWLGVAYGLSSVIFGVGAAWAGITSAGRVANRWTDAVA
ncbi:fluoride efflux transporter FluC [Mycolicibacterium chlorophenolicum]|uniref:Fluoride-specific ion channel FluC n=1 Tax=Mycolicibacterium chlorophenolicum TaxID=37916 RepID=A0A0J6WKJ9_9MYCO|nr:CrcB family protein [Mycolicibacterium chlorophenolicum]KMO82513.1 putative fluoride ion transporter CrcB [Mycolicibacterium chlorophenolicum]